MELTSVASTQTPCPAPPAASVEHDAAAASSDSSAVAASASGTHSIFRCGIGWVMFGLGWVLYLPFLVGALMPLFDPEQRTVPHKRAAWIANIILSGIYSVLIAVLIALAVTGVLPDISTGGSASSSSSSSKAASGDLMYTGSASGVAGSGF